MPIGIIAAGIGAVGAIGGAVISSNASGHASDIAAQTAANNNTLQKQIYTQNTANEQPFMNNGTSASNNINSLLGLGGSSPAGTAAAGNAFNQYLGSTGYQFQEQQGMQGLDNNYALRGALDSGAAVKAAQGYNQNLASNYFSNYLGQLQTQQGVGVSAANALNGVGNNYANAVSNNNNNAASAAGSAAIGKGNALSNGLTNFGTSIGQMSGSSYGGGSYGGGGQSYGQTAQSLSPDGSGIY